MNNANKSNKGEAIPRIAVIAVHGVGPHTPGATAKAVADLLPTSEYWPCLQSELRIITEPIEVPKSDGQARASDRELQKSDTPVTKEAPETGDTTETGDKAEAARKFESESKVKAEHNAEAEAKGKPEADPKAEEKRKAEAEAKRKAEAEEKRKTEAEDKLPFDYMADQLRELEISEKDRVYETIRLETYRSKGASGPEAELHIHELYWSDISHPGPGVFRGIIDLYRLIFDLCSLGRHSLDAAIAIHPSKTLWKRFRQIHAVAEWSLVQAIPITNLCVLMVVATAFLSVSVPESFLFWVCTGLPALYLGGGIAFELGTTASKSLPKDWHGELRTVLLAAVWGWIIGFLIEDFSQSPERMAALLLWPIPLGGFLWLMHHYEKYRPHAFLTGIVAAIGTTIFFAYQVCTVCLPQPVGAGHILDAALRTIEGIFLVMSFAWVGLALSMILMGAVGFIAVVTSQDRQKLSRTAWTANLTIFLPALIVVVCNVALWSAVAKSMPAFNSPKGDPFIHLRLFPSEVLNAVTIEPDGKTRYESANAAANQLAKDGGKFMPRGVFILGVGLLITVWSLAPAVWHEFWPIRRRHDETKAQNGTDDIPAQQTTPEIPAQQTTPDPSDVSKWLGQTLTNAFFSLRLAGEWIRWAAISTTLITFYYTYVWPDGLMNIRPFPFEEYCTPGAEAVLAAIVIALVVSSGPFKFLALGFRVVLDAVIDVINWLRLHPLKANPRARISARFASLLLHISDKRQGYDAIIVVAHSQGTVISADVLRFLKHQNDKEQNRKFASLFDGHMPIYLFTMGSPLRQLYSLRFPYLYGWARGEYGNENPLKQATTSVDKAPQSDDCATQTVDMPTQSVEKQKPCPRALGVVRWTNAYSSGDYVGRCLWRSENELSSWTIVRQDGSATKQRDELFAEGKGVEFCIGTGAHMHYWDGANDVVAEELHFLISDAVASARKPM